VEKVEVDVWPNQESTLQPNTANHQNAELTITTPSNPILDEEWKNRGSCSGVNPALFYPESQASTKDAKKVCGSCPVRYECLEFAIEKGEKFGIWGGLTARERRHEVRNRKLIAQTAIQSASQAE
jgi:WhiB family transcriptional regulator, redox-sensing transcriptional regulator